MRKISVLLICLMIIFSGTVFAENNESASSAEKTLISWYYTHKNELLPEYYGYSGVEEAMLADIDNDGIPELLFSYSLYHGGLTVYKVRDGKVIEIPERIGFGRGTDIHEELALLMDNDGHMYIYRYGVHAFMPDITSESGTTIEAIYDWSENGFTTLKYLEITYDRINGKILYTAELNADTESTIDWDFPKTQISDSEAEAKINEFENQLNPYIVWSDNDDDKNSGIDRIWNRQKERFVYNKSIGADKCIVLQIDNPLMSVDGERKPVDGSADTVPIVKDGRALVPVRAVVEEMGGAVEWDNVNNMAILSYSGKTIKLVIGSNIAYLDDSPQNLDVAPVVVNGRTMLPIRFIAENFGFDVNWRELTQQIVITEYIINDSITKDSVNYDLLSCIGKTKEEITRTYGNIVDSEYWNGGKYYVHNNLKSQIFYENPDNAYDYERHDDAENNYRCLHMFVNLSELFNTPDESGYTLEELRHVFGDYEIADDLENDMMPLCIYRFTLGDYRISIESDHKIHEREEIEYVYVFGT